MTPQHCRTGSTEAGLERWLCSCHQHGETGTPPQGSSREGGPSLGGSCLLSAGLRSSCFSAGAAALWGGCPPHPPPGRSHSSAGDTGRVGGMGHEPPRGTGPPRREDTSPRGRGTPGNGDTPVAHPLHSPPAMWGARSPKAPLPPPSPCRGGPGAAHQLLVLPPQAAERPRAAEPVAGGHHVIGELGGQEGGGPGGATPLLCPPPHSTTSPHRPPRRSQPWGRAQPKVLRDPAVGGTPLLGDPPQASTPFTFHFLRALNVRKFFMLMEERLRFSACCRLRGCRARTRRCHHVPNRSRGSGTRHPPFCPVPSR